MAEKWIERVRNWLCRTFGHRAEIQYGCGDPEICLRCRQLLSTAYSRAKEPTP